jgi:hypothetical protein
MDPPVADGGPPNRRAASRNPVEGTATGKGEPTMPELTYIASMVMAVVAWVVARSD